jgi:serine O-acetyltransferase
MASQFSYFYDDIKSNCGKNKARIIIIWLSRTFAGIFLYRFERSLFLFFGRFYNVIRLLYLPIINLIQAYSNIDIHYKADIKGGLSILHPSMGITISGNAIIGKNLTLTGGNVIGITKKCTKGEFVVGDNCNLGANAVIMGPLIIADDIKIGALACVTKNFLDPNLILVGIPATPLNKQLN